MRVLMMIAQAVLAVVLTPLAITYGVRGLINLATRNDFNQQYQLHFAVSHYATYVTALLLALIFWLVGRLTARLLGASRIPSFLSLIATLVLALAAAHASQLPMTSEIERAFYAMSSLSVPAIAYPLAGALLAALLVPGKRRN